MMLTWATFSPQIVRAIGGAAGALTSSIGRGLCALWSLGVGAAAGRGWALVPLQGAWPGAVAAYCCQMSMIIRVCFGACVLVLLQRAAARQ